MNKLIIFVVYLSVFSCSMERKIERIVYEFYPSFLSPITYSIDLNKKKLYQNSKFYKEERIIIGSSNLINKEYDISDENLRLFLNEILEIKLDSSITHKRDVLDGIGFKFNTIVAFPFLGHFKIRQIIIINLFFAKEVNFFSKS